MSATSGSSDVGKKDFEELFDFLKSDRADIRKMAISGLAPHSKDNDVLESYLIRNDVAASNLCLLIRVEEVNLLGDLFTVLINVCCNSMVASTVVNNSAVHKTLRLLDHLERSDNETVTRLEPVLREMGLMLLNNLTAIDNKAVHDAVQDDDEDLKGFYLGKLHRYYSQMEDGDKKRKWILNIILNCTKFEAGQVVLLEEDDWKDELPLMLRSTDPANAFARSVAFNIIRNCSIGRAQPLWIELEFPQLIIELMAKPDQFTPEEQCAAIDALSLSLAGEPAMQVMEEINAKKSLLEHQDKMCEAAREMLTKDVLPYLDDIQDVYTVGGDDE